MIMKERESIFFATAASAVLLAAYTFFRNRRREPQWKAVAKVSQMFVHPVKSCRGITMDTIQCCKHGVMIAGTRVGDRCFLIVQEDGERVTAHKFPSMIFIECYPLGKDKMLLKAPGMDYVEFSIPKYDHDVKVSNHKVLGEECPAIDCGDEVSQWLGKYLKHDNLRVVFHDSDLPLAIRKKLLNFQDLDVYKEEPVCSVFQNFSPFNLVSEASLQELNTKHEKPVSMRNFRPNVVVSGCEAFAEDNWRYVRIGTAEFKFAKYGNRCPLTTIDPETGVKSEDSHPLSTLKEFRLCKPEEKKLYGTTPKFSVDFVVTKPGIINVSDTVYVLE